MNNEINLGDYAIRRKSSHEPEKWVVFLVNETYVDLIKEHPEDYAPLVHNGCYWIRYNASSPWEMAKLNKYSGRWIFFDGWRLLKDVLEVDPCQVMRQRIFSKSAPKSPDIVPSINLNEICHPVLFAMNNEVDQISMKHISDPVTFGLTMSAIAHAVIKADKVGETIFLISIPDADQERAMQIQSLVRTTEINDAPDNTPT